MLSNRNDVIVARCCEFEEHAVSRSFPPQRFLNGRASRLFQLQLALPALKTEVPAKLGQARIPCQPAEHN
jgi:hypothetical protein